LYFPDMLGNHILLSVDLHSTLMLEGRL